MKLTNEDLHQMIFDLQNRVVAFEARCAELEAQVKDLELARKLNIPYFGFVPL